MEIGRSRTINPLAPAEAVRAPQIKSVLNLRTGRVHDAVVFISRHRHADLVRFRSRLLEAMLVGRPRMACALCQVPVYVVASPLKAFFFRHRTEDGSCPAVTRNFESEAEIRARQYAGLQESEAHRRLKRLLTMSMAADPRFADIAEEQSWKATTGVAALRRPDVSCVFGSYRLAFEAQLSTTFLSVVVGRRAFYRAQGGLLVWVLAHFDPHHRRMTEDDILFPNNSNLLVVDDETAAASVAAGQFMVKCWFRHPALTARETSWSCELVNFGRLTLDVPQQRAYLIDVEGEEGTLRERAARERVAALEADNQALRDDFMAFWRAPFDPDQYEAREAARDVFEWRFRSKGIPFPSRSYAEWQHLDRRLKVILSAREGEPVGWGYKRLPEIAHHLHDQHPHLLMEFGHLLRLYGHDQTLKAQDRSGAWRKKADQLRREMRGGSVRYQPQASWTEALCFLFPEAGDVLASALAAQAA